MKNTTHGNILTRYERFTYNVTIMKLDAVLGGEYYFVTVRRKKYQSTRKIQGYETYVFLSLQ